MEYIFLFLIFILAAIFVYDKYVQREHQLLINYPVIGRFRYFFEAVREPFRQYFGNENFYESKDKIDWVYNAAHDKVGYVSFSPSQPQLNPKFLIKHANIVLNESEVDEKFETLFGQHRPHPYVAKTIIGRSAMSDGAISPEGTMAFVGGAYQGHFPINTGEGSLTTNFFATHKVDQEAKYITKISLNGFDKFLYYGCQTLFNRHFATRLLKKKLLDAKEADTYLFDEKQLLFFRIDWNAPLENFPKEVPTDMPDIVFQIGSGLYGVRDKEGNFDEDKYQKTLSFCKMTEIKLAQGAKQTGGKIAKNKVTSSIAYYRGVKANEALISPNRFPYAHDVDELLDFVAKLQKLSKKPVGFKIVISSLENIEEFAKEIHQRKLRNLAGVPDFITIDGGDGGSATAPLYLMDRIGLNAYDAIYLSDFILKKYGLRDDIKIIASSKILTPDDVMVIKALGADFINIARGFMMSAGCIRARMCSGNGSHQCPVGLATQDKELRSAYLIEKNIVKIANYHKNLLHGVKTILSVMGISKIDTIDVSRITFIDRDGFVYQDVDAYMQTKLGLK